MEDSKDQKSRLRSEEGSRMYRTVENRRTANDHKCNWLQIEAPKNMDLEDILKKIDKAEHIC